MNLSGIATVPFESTVARTGARTSNLIVIILGGGLTLLLAYALITELGSHVMPLLLTFFLIEADSEVYRSSIQRHLYPGYVYIASTELTHRHLLGRV